MASMENHLLGPVAAKAVAALGIREGHLVEIRADIAAHQWAEIIAVFVERDGGIPFLNLASVQYYKERIVSLPLDQLSTPPPFLVEMSRRVNAIIVVERDWSQLSRTCPPDKLAAWIKAMGVIVEQLEVRQVPDCQIVHPDALPEEHLSVSREELRRNLESALIADSNKIQARAEYMASRLALHRQLEIFSGDSRRLAVQFEGRPIRKGDGKLHEDRVVNFPYGSVYFTLIEDSVEGSIYFEKWQDVDGLVLSFQQGRLCEVKADRNVHHFEKLLAAHTGDKDRVSHIGIGVNPGLSVYTGHIALDECRAGSVFLALGENRYLGGTNASTLNLDLVSQKATVKEPNGALVVDGKLMLG